MPADENGYSLEQERAALSLKQNIRIKVRLAIRKKASPLWVGITAVVLIAALALSQTFLFGKVEKNGAATKNPGTQLTFVGDTMVGRSIEKICERDGYSTLFSGVKHVWKNSDFVFANLEGALLVGNAEKYHENDDGTDMNIFLSASTKSVKNMVKSGINVLAYANNHVADYKKKSVTNAVEWFDKNNIKFSGIRREFFEELPEETTVELAEGETTTMSRDITSQEAKYYTLLKTDSGKRIGFVSITASYYPETVKYDVITTKDTMFYSYVSSSARDNDLTVVYMHWGSEGVSTVSKEQQDMAHLLIDAGADVVIGCHPQVLQSAEVYNDGIIFYSLGNFVYDISSTFSRDSAIVQFNEAEDGGRQVIVMPVRINGGRPEITENAFYGTRIRKALTSMLDKNVYKTDEAGNLVITLK